MKLLVDFGNTRLKWALHDAGQLKAGGVFAHSNRALATALRNDWLALPRRPDGVLVASVVGAEREAELTALTRNLFSVDPQWLKSPTEALGIQNAYVEPSRLGIDRFLALAAIHGQNPRAQVLASVGTALTVDALAADGRHLGGLIVASPTLMRSALRDATARLNTPIGRLVEIATGTADAVQSGALVAAVAMIERFRQSVAVQLGSTPALILAGGGGEELVEWLPDAERSHDLVLRGLARWADADATSC